MGPVDRRGRLEEHHRVLGRLHTQFGGVVGIVEPDADQLAHLTDRRPDARAARHQRQALRIDPGQVGQNGPCEVGHHTAEVT